MRKQKTAFETFFIFFSLSAPEITSLKRAVEEKMAKLWEFAGFKVHQ